MNTIVNDPIRITNFDQLRKGDKIWTVDHSGKYQIIMYICVLPETGSTYAIFLDHNKDGMPKFHHSNLLNREWYKYEESEETWYHIYKKVAEHYDNLHQTSITAIKSLIEPITIIILAFGVGFILLSMFVPMFGVYNTIG